MRELSGLRTLRRKVYEYLRDKIQSRELSSNEFLDLNLIGRELGMSRSPLRDALIQLEVEGFVTVYPRRGVKLRSLDLETIRNIYEVMGALESSTLIGISTVLGRNDVAEMSALNDRMIEALDADDFDVYYRDNVAFHNVYLGKSQNAELLNTVRILRDRLYDFQIRKEIKKWEYSSVAEHREIVALLAQNDFNGAADYLRDVHWSFSVQQRYIRFHYHLMKSEGASGASDARPARPPQFDASSPAPAP